MALNLTVTHNLGDGDESGRVFNIKVEHEECSCVYINWVKMLTEVSNGSFRWKWQIFRVLVFIKILEKGLISLIWPLSYVV
jgi:hypothetical protein